MSDYSVRPSKRFLIRGGIAIGLVVLILLVQTVWFKNLFRKNDTSTTVTSDLTVGDMVTRDTNGNGVPDWEEKLWGLDPTVLYTNGVSNRQIIEEKKRALGVTTDSAPANETDQLARELFALTQALGQSEEIDAQTLREIAMKMGSSIDTDKVSNQYSLKDVQTIQTATPSLQAYYAAMTRITGITTTNTADIEVIISALETGDTSRIPELEESATIYKKMAKDLIAIKVPVGVAPYHLAIVNGISGIAQSFAYLQGLTDNGVSALIGVAIYKNYTATFNRGLNDMRDYLMRYGILEQ